MNVVEIIFGYPTVFFTTLLLTSTSYWVLSLLLGFDSGGGADLDLEVDVGGDGSGSDGSSSEPGALIGLLQAFDLHLLPVALALTLVSLVGFAISALATAVLTDSSGSTAVLVGLVIGVVALLGGMFVAGKIAILLAPVFVPEPAVRRADLIGRICTVRTGSVSSIFGQAEATDGVLGSHLIQVRCGSPNSLGAGSPALIVSVDVDGDYIISPDVAGLV